MALDSAVFSSRTVLSGFSDRSVLSGLSDAAWSGPAAPRVPSAAGDNDAVARIWAFLFSRTERPPIVPLSTASVVPGKLFHYKASHFGLGTAHAHLGEGACYRVDKRELSPTQGGFVVAVKTPKLQASASVSSQQQAHAASLILRELQVLTYPPLHLHPNIASILGYSSELIGQHAHGLSLSLVVDLASHGTLKDFLARPLRGEGKERHSLKTKVRLLHDVASGLHALHACGIVQADVKTENVLVFTDAESAKDQTSKAEADEDDGESSLIARLSDFGYAIPVEQESGTQRYMGTSVLNAPEVQRNSQIPNGDLWKCDVFSFALLVWETALDGKRYFSTSASTPIKGQSDVMEWLAGLPRDDLLRLALKSLQDAYGPSEPPLMAILQRVLKSSLRDEKDRRRPMSEIVNIFRRQRFLAAAARSRDARMQFKPEPFSQNQPSSVTDTKSEGGLSSVPESVRQSVLANWHLTAQDETASSLDRHRAYLDLATASFSHFSGEPNALAGMTYLRDAAAMGCIRALALYLRLKAAFPNEASAVPLVQHAGAVQLTSDLSALPPNSCLSQWLSAMENHYQREALKAEVRVMSGDRVVISASVLLNLEQSLGDVAPLDFEQLSVVPLVDSAFPAAADNPCFGSQLLVEVACRLGLLDLVRLLVPTEPSSDGGLTWTQKDLLARGLREACRGAHLDVVEYLAQLGAQFLNTPKDSSFHWLFMFPRHQRARAMEVLMGCFEDLVNFSSKEVDTPGAYLGILPLSGTPIEFALAIGDTATVKILVDKVASVSKQRSLVGFGEDTFRRAVANHLASAIKHLLPHELRRRRSDGLHEAMARMRLSRGERELEPFGIFDVGRSESSLSLLLLHGSIESAAAAVDDTINVILHSGIASINDIEPLDKMGPTPLAVAVRWSPCSFDTSILRSLISRGGNFSEMPDLLVLARLVGPRPPGTKARVMHQLLKSGLLHMNSNLLSRIIEIGDAEMVAAVLDWKPAGIYASHVLSDNDYDTEMTLLQAAVLIPGAAKLVKLLIDRGAPIDEALGGFPPLELAIMKPADHDIIDILITSGASPVSRDFPTVIHSAARLRSYVNGCHILTHLLRHERLREVTTTTCTTSDKTVDRISPVHVACYAANVEAIAALLESGVEMPRDGQWDVLRHATMVGKRPHINPVNPIPEEQEEAVYEMRLRVEHLVLYLLDRLQPNHGRTPLHVAMELGNFRRVVELVEQDFDALQVQDGTGFLPLHYMEGPDSLEEQRATREDITEKTVANVKRLSDYIGSTISRQKSEMTGRADSKMAEIAMLTGDKDFGGLAAQFIKAVNGDPDTLQEAGQQVRDHLAKLRAEFLKESAPDGDASAQTAPPGSVLDRLLLDERPRVHADEDSESDQEEDYVHPKDRTFIVLDGDDDPEDLLEAAAKCFEKHTQELTSLHPKTIKAAECLCELYFTLDHKEEGRNLVIRILEWKRASLPENDPEVFYGWRDQILALMDLDQGGEAVAEAERAKLTAQQYFGASHPACLTFVPILALQKDLQNEFEACVKDQQNVLTHLHSLKTADAGRRVAELQLEVLVHLGYHMLGLEKSDSIGEIIRECLGVFSQVDPCDFLGTFGNLTQFAKDMEDTAPQQAQTLFQGLLGTCSHRLRRGSHCLLEARRNLASHFAKRGMLDEARVQNRRLITGLKLRKGAEHMDTLRAIVEDVKVLQKQGLVPEAIHVLLPTTKMLERVYGSDLAETLEAKSLLAELLLTQEELEDWEMVAREVIQGYAQLDPISDAAIDAERALALTLGNINRAEEARQIALRCLEKSCEVYGENHERTMMILPELQRYTFRSGLYDANVAVCERALKAARELYGPRSPSVADWLSLAGNSLCVVGEEGSTRGAEMLQQSSELAVELNGGKHNYSSLLSLYSVGKVYRLECKEEEAVKILDDVLKEAYCLIDEEPHRFKIRTRVELGRCYDDMGQHDKALPHLKRAVQEARNLWGDSHKETIDYINSLVGALSQLDRDKDALPLAREVLDYRQDTVGPSHADTISATNRLAELYFALDKCTAADFLWEKVLRELIKQGDEADPDDVACYRHRRAKALMRTFGYADAKELAAQSAEYYREAKGEEDEDTLRTLTTLAQAKSQVDGLADAVAMVRKVIRTCGNPPKKDLEGVLEDAQLMLATLVGRDGQTHANPEEAETLLKEAVHRDGSNIGARTALFAAYKRQEKYMLAEEQALAVQSQLHDDDDESSVSAEERLVSLYMQMGDWDKARGWAEALWARFQGMTDYQGNHLDVIIATRTMRDFFEHTGDEERLLQAEVLGEAMRKQLPFQIEANIMWNKLKGEEEEDSESTEAG